MQLTISLLCAVSLFVMDCSNAAPALQLPVVDLDYGLWQATFNSTGQYYNFSNIRYAQSPVGNLRFASPLSPLKNRSTVNDGQDGRICPQGFLASTQESALFLEAYLTNPDNISAFANPTSSPSSASISIDGRTNEDCLFLNVIVPKSIYDNANTTKGAPILVWSFGGGFYSGSAESQGNPAGLVARSVSGTSPGMIYVSFNYRLGALGWLSGPTFSTSGGTQNAGLYDQRLVLEWVQQHIQKFGGDPKRVTVAGESAGAAMILHQITAFANSTDAPFQQAYISSPAFNPNPYHFQQETIFQRVLQSANVTNLEGLRSLSSTEMIAANIKAILQAPYGSSGFGPIIGDIFAPQHPDLLLAQGKRAQNVKSIIVEHNVDEGLLFTNPSVQNNSAFDAYLKTLLPDAQQSVLDEISNQLYPPNFNKTASGYNDTISRVATMLSDLFVSCNANSLFKSFNGSSNGLLFGEGAGIHGEDTSYLFYNNDTSKDIYGLGINTTSAIAMQNWMINFVANGNPNTASGTKLPMYGSSRSMGLVANQDLGVVIPDPSVQQRCDFWQKGLYY